MDDAKNSLLLQNCHVTISPQVFHGLIHCMQFWWTYVMTKFLQSCQNTRNFILMYNAIMTWNCFTHHWSFVSGVMVDLLHEGPVIREVWFFFVVSLNKLLNCWWFKMTWGLRNITLMGTKIDKINRNYFSQHFPGKLFSYTGLILGLCPANERCWYKVMLSLIGWARTESALK